MYAVVEIGGHQYKVTKGDVIRTDRLGLPAGETFNPKVLMVKSDDGKVKVGNPYLDDAKVEMKVLGEEKGEKVMGFKYKAKKRYRRRWGIRPIYSKLEVIDIKA